VSVRARAERALSLLHRAEDGLLALLLSALVIIATLQIVLRLGFDEGFAFADPLARALVLWIGLLGALAATRDDRHIAFDPIASRLTGPLRRAAHALAMGFAALVCGALAVYALELVKLEREAPSDWILGLSSDVPQWILPLGFGLMALRFVLRAALGPRRA
jgi:TRAP-type C4-dicarboxylate transport system permease small subunit